MFPAAAFESCLVLLLVGAVHVMTVVMIMMKMKMKMQKQMMSSTCLKRLQSGFQAVLLPFSSLLLFCVF